MDYSRILNSPEYEFIQTNPHLGRQVILLGLAGSYAYGTNREGSDLDVRGIALNRKQELLGRSSFEQYVDDNTDTTVYAFNKVIGLLEECNPNTIELLGLKDEHYLYLTGIGRELLERKKLFLSRRAIQSFGGYADQQLRRLQNALARDSVSQAEQEKHRLNSINNALYGIRDRYESFESGSLRLYIDKAADPGLDQEIFLDVSLKHYPLRDYRNMLSEFSNILKDYDKLGKRNRKKDGNHLDKHAMHLIRLFMMAIDILEKEEINTCREKEHELLMRIRGGEFRKEDGQYREEFYELLEEYETRLAYAAEHTSLPAEPDRKKIEEFVMSVNERVVRGEY